MVFELHLSKFTTKNNLTKSICYCFKKSQNKILGTGKCSSYK